MIKRTLLFGNPAYLSTKHEQLLVQYPDAASVSKNIPIEDIGVIVLEHPQITITNNLLEKLIANNAAVITCNKQHLPISCLLPLDGHTEQSERFKFQVNASRPLKKNLWQQTIVAKILNQAAVLKKEGLVVKNMKQWASKVTSGDTKNHEARAAAYYWPKLFDDSEFLRSREGLPPNNLLNYGYAILRAITARALVGSGLHPTFGIHHRNKYNAYCLADDIMEPYRPYVDALVREMYYTLEDMEQLTPSMKQILLKIPVIDVVLEGKKSPLMIAMSRTTNSLVDCFKGESRKLLYPRYA